MSDSNIVDLAERRAERERVSCNLAGSDFHVSETARQFFIALLDVAIAEADRKREVVLAGLDATIEAAVRRTLEGRSMTG